MTTKTVTIGGEGGSVVITKSDDGATMINSAPETGGSATMVPVVVHRHHHPLDSGSFAAGLMLGLLLYFIVQTAMRWHARREARGHARAAAIGPQRATADDSVAAAVAALARRTATLETIVTDPAQRTAREIEALRDPVAHAN